LAPIELSWVTSFEVETGAFVAAFAFRHFVENLSPTKQSDVVKHWRY
jgi:hypothetical protein